MPTLSIDTEATACRAAFAGVPVGSLVAHCHHEGAFEPLTEDAEARIAYILAFKPRQEQALRLRLFRPVPTNVLARYPQVAEASAQYSEARAQYNEALAQYNEACAQRNEAYAQWNETYAQRDKASAQYNEACAQYSETYAQWNKALAQRDKVCAQYSETYAPLHNILCPAGKDCPWDGTTIFPQLREA